MYDVPGRADSVSSAVTDAWNELIQAIYNSMALRHPGTFLELDPAAITDGQTINAVRWAAAPAVPLDCLNRNEDLTRALCDFGVRGRHVLHNEYLEYKIVRRRDEATGAMRPKRVILTTELREYWTTLAVHDPEFCRTLAGELVDGELEWSDLYGSGVTDPFDLSEDERLRRFSREVAGDGGMVSGLPSQPRGRLNTENLLFMTHPINGLDDLIFIVMFGAKPYVVRQLDGTFRSPTKFEIFGNGNALACRNADPGAATAASAQARDGKKLAFANPLGMYILTEPNLLRQQFFMNDATESEIPVEWIRLSRGEAGMHQRLEFGPDDESPFFLDNIRVAVGGTSALVLGGYDIAQKVEVGPLLVVDRLPSVDPVSPVVVAAIEENEQIPCSRSPECRDVLALRQEFQQAQP